MSKTLDKMTKKELIERVQELQGLLADAYKRGVNSGYRDGKSIMKEGFDKVVASNIKLKTQLEYLEGKDAK